MNRIYIDPGHSKNDPGAVKYAVERDLNEKVAKYMNEHLQANYICETKVDPITTNSVSKVAANANAWKADLLVSIHFNAGRGDGYEGLVHSSARKALGLVFEKHVKAAGQNSRGVKYRPDLGVLRLSNMPAILNEGAFVDNKKDIQDWDEDPELKKLGVAYAEAAAEWLKLEKRPAPVPAPTPDPADGLYRVFDKNGKQVGAYSKEANAFEQVKKQLQTGGSAKITLSDK